MNAASSASRARDARRTHDVELSSQLRAAIMNEDDALLRPLLGQLLRAEGLTKGQRVARQMRVLLNLLHSLRGVALNDEVTGLYNRYGFIQAGTRLLNRAVWDETAAQLIYFQLDPKPAGAPSGAPDAAEAGEQQARQMGAFLRDLCPSHAAHDVLARLGAGEFAALTTSVDLQLASRRTLQLRARRQRGGSVTFGNSLRVGVARFNPSRPVTLVQLLERARRASDEPDAGARDAAPLQRRSSLPAGAASGRRAATDARAAARDRRPPGV